MPKKNRTATSAARISTVPPQLFLFECRGRVGHRAVGRAGSRAGAVTRATPPAVAGALALAQSGTRTIRLRSAVGTDATVLFEARGLPRGAFFLGLRRPAITPAIAGPASPVLCEHRKGCAANQQSCDYQTYECFMFHTCSFVCFVGRLRSARYTRIDHLWINMRPVRGLQSVYVVRNK
jgi:hypothetical protein